MEIKKIKDGWEAKDFICQDCGYDMTIFHDGKSIKKVPGGREGTPNTFYCGRCEAEYKIEEF